LHTDINSPISSLLSYRPETIYLSHPGLNHSLSYFTTPTPYFPFCNSSNVSLGAEFSLQILAMAYSVSLAKVNDRVGLIVTASLFTVIAISAVAIRFYSRRLKRAVPGPDDWLALVALVRLY
jgi:hypothetical protein